MNARTPGQIAFDAYGEAAGWKTFDGRPMPRWDEPLPHMVETRRRWEVAAEAVISAITAKEPA